MGIFYVCNNGKLVRNLHLVIKPEIVLTELLVPLKEIEIIGLQQINNLYLLNMFLEPMGLTSKEFWIEFLLHQNSLCYFQVNRRSLFYSIAVSLIEQVVPKNANTLKALTLELQLQQSNPL